LFTPFDQECNVIEDECKPYDPECAPPDEINEWLKGKKLMMKMLNYKIDFEDFENTTRV